MTDIFYTDSELQKPSAQSVGICNERKNKLEPIKYDEYTQWLTGQKKNYGNFMNLTTSPQRNPYGINGNRQAMKDLEIQKPNRPSNPKNPFMNVPISNYNIPQNFGKAQPHCGKACKKNFYKSLFRSPDDALWNRQASERQFYTTPNSSVPNEQVKFAEWLYGNNQVGKTGSIYDRYGYPYTPDSMVNTGINAASPQNAGQVENNFGTPVVPGASPWVNNPNYGYGFGGVPGGIPFHNLTMSSPQMMMNPHPFFPVYPSPVMLESQGTIPPMIQSPQYQNID
jgi:hypothetical protein